MPGKRNALQWKDKLEIIELSGKLSVKELRKKFGCGKTQVYHLLKNKEKIREEWLKCGMKATGVRLKKCRHEAINAALFEWYEKARASNLPLSGAVLQERAKRIAAAAGCTAFKASNGWLDSFRARHSISFKRTSGGAGRSEPKAAEEEDRRPDTRPPAEGGRTQLTSTHEESSASKEAAEERPEVVENVESFDEALRKIAGLERFAVRIASDDLRYCMLNARTVVEKAKRFEGALRKVAELEEFAARINCDGLRQAMLNAKTAIAGQAPPLNTLPK